MHWGAFVLFPVIGLVGGARAQDPALDPDAAPHADRIWSANADDREVWLRRSFALPTKVTTARFVFTCDNECRVMVNGKEVATATSWMDVTVVDLDGLLRDNVVAIEAKNTGGPGAFAGWLLWTDEKGDAQHLISDPTWRITTAPGDAAQGWDDVGFDDSGWVAATANFDSVFGKNLYNDNPGRVHFQNRHSAHADKIERALQRLRGSLDRKTARQALDAIERAVMDLRAALWREEAAEKAGEAPGTAR